MRACVREYVRVRVECMCVYVLCVCVSAYDCGQHNSQVCMRIVLVMSAAVGSLKERLHSRMGDW